jgi:hypothetical protein
MKRRLTLALVGAAALTASIALAQTSRDDQQKPKTPAGQKDTGINAPQDLPPGMTEEQMQACMEAATPGEMHEFLTDAVGVWHGETKMWMAPDSEPMVSECTSTIGPMMDGRFTKCEIAGEMEGMGAFNGFGLYGFDNVSQKFQSTWVDNMGTGMMVGAGELSSDGKTLTWEYTYNCPIRKKPTTMREVERRTGPNTTVLEMYGPHLETGKEYKMMEIAFTRKSDRVGSAR